jgi:riboflavin biosynthesis pyrimidine reductase
VRLRRLHPEPGLLEATDAMDRLGLAELAPPERPRLVLNMVASADGRATVEGSGRPLSGPADRVVFHALRGQVDALLIGTRTLRSEPYGRLVADPARRAAREARGLRADPLAVVLTRSGDVPRDSRLFAEPEQEVVVLREAPADALRRLRAEHGVRSLLCEGGPTLNGALLAAGLVDELFLTLSPMLAGGADPLTIVAGDGAAAPLELVWVLEGDGALFLRYRVGRAHG